ncbi:uncharacterized protein EV154DRAFT_478154 [Mucor mucedo]|uniref:uncharacterized protein n=1 Tax=Mucor mucedo TaxID=29922 RepID=UPI002220E6B0|nr:uncharacterized protein EV154DRAFT_478154 [Mucor mucedo]KAI7894759.1 hypothetical protein EV154DRAFT_478154 [Mucor mucedo]
MLATSVMKDGENTRLGKTNVENLLSEFNMEMNANHRQWMTPRIAWGVFASISILIIDNVQRLVGELLSRALEFFWNSRDVNYGVFTVNYSVFTSNSIGLIGLLFWTRIDDSVYDHVHDIDSHAKQRSSTGSTPQSTSVPSLGHNDSVICSMRQIEGSNVSIKLTLGTHSFNALGAASTRIDNLVDHPECGP